MAIEWLADHLRVSLFSNAAVQVTEEDWCAITAEKEAAARQTIPGGRIFSGRFGTGLLNLSGAYNRIDIILSTQPPTELPAEPQFASVGPWASTRDRFSELTLSWIERTKCPIVRVAFGTVLNCTTANRNGSYDLLKRMVTSVKIDSNKMSEFFYRVNWPTQSSIIPGLTINRITSWSAVLVLYSSVQVHSPIAPTSIPQLYGTRLEIDNSTDISRTEPFSQNELTSILKELISYASESALSGDPK